ncbi:E3 ubiquitin-protein ligase MSL2 isoform X2 [Condylostylus longicornis]|uniref:E3 ubiquitin-protein ligase MSL2 isoform X2 n=1 Tax=Condylostylus longicornis TaxID=2530218 RepID=UPI00244DBA0E|nr:E3 ubiquitin-protein ligase MSL2 isoform X2 [Condylostylus longicornis]
MNATSLYVTTSRLVFQSEYGSTDQNWTDLYRLVPYLRQSLSCLVCGKLLTEPQKPSDGKCQHHVCKKCIIGRKILKPSCVHCRDNNDLDSYEENIQMRILLQCYKYLCQYIMSTALYKTNIVNSGGALNGTDAAKATLLQFIEEGANFPDNFKANSGLTKSAYSILPCVFSPPLPSNSPAPLSPQPSSIVQSPPIPLSHSPQLLQAQPLSSPTLIIQQQTSQPVFQTSSPLIQIHQQCGTYPKKILQNQIQKSQTAQQQPLQHQTPPPLTLVSNSVCLSPSSANPNLKITKSNTVAQPSIKTFNSISNIGNTKAVNINQNQVQNNVISWPKNGIPIISSPVNVNSNISATSNDQKPCSATTISQTVPIRNPPPIKTVSNGSAMYSVLYTGIGNKITIKRKTDGEDEIKKNNIQYPPPRPSINKTVSKRRGCRCGNATATPGKLTCCGQRCPCYVDSKSCIDCKCRGCRNPHRPDGCKIRPVIPELACYEIQIADDSTNLSPNTSMTSIATSSSATTTANFAQQTQLQQPFQKASPVSSSKINATSLKNCTMEIPLDDFNASNTSNLLGNIVVASPHITNASSTTSTTFTYTTQPTFVVKKPQTITIGTNQVKRQQIQQQQQQSTQIQPQTIKIENTSTESLLIKSADGKYQAALPIQTSSLVTTKHHIPEISTTLPQIIMQPQSQQNTTPTILSASSASNYQTNNINNSSLHNHHQQQLITTTQQVSSPTTITLSPIIVTSSDQSFPTEIFSEEEITSSSSPLPHPPPLHFSGNHHPHLVEVVHADDL